MRGVSRGRWLGTRGDRDARTRPRDGGCGSPVVCTSGPDPARGARPAGGGKPAAYLPGARHAEPQMPSARPKRSAVLPGAEPLCTPSGQFTEPCVARPAGRFINRPVYYADSRLFDLASIFAKRAGNLPAVLRAANSVCSATLNPT